MLKSKNSTTATWELHNVLLLLILTMATSCQSVPPENSGRTTPTASVEPTLITSSSTPGPAVTEPVASASIVLPTALPTTTISPTSTSIRSLYGLSARASVPSGVIDRLQESLDAPSSDFVWTTSGDQDRQVAEILVGDGVPIASWVYAAAAPFATVTDETTLEQIQAAWQTGSSELGGLILDEATMAALSAAWGAPSEAVRFVERDALVSTLWSNRPSWSILPFNELDPALKVLQVDGVSPLDRNFNPESYPLSIQVSIGGDEEAVSHFIKQSPGMLTNYDPGRITRVAMSGVTALARATAYQMELRGITVPGEIVAPIMQQADVAHVSHEVSFVADCPYPNPIGDPIFCARDSYLELLTYIGTDVAELTGNHLNDWGQENTARSVDLYEQAGMEVFGGGRNLDQARQPLLFEHNGNKIAFLGCNPVGPPNDWATDFQAGSLPCDYTAFKNQIGQLSEAGYFVIATLQYAEFYQYAPTDQQRQDFRALVDAGAGAVSGSQGHHAQGFDLYQGAFIHFGLGNLFFDQMDMLGTRQSFIDTYIIFDGRLISVTLFTSLIENYCCPREMSPAERAGLLEAVFQASGW